MLDPICRTLQGLGYEPAALNPPILATAHEAGGFEDAQVLGYGWQRHLVGRGKRGDRRFAGGQPRQDSPARGVG